MRFVVERIVRSLVVLMVILVMSFGFMSAIPGDPVTIRLGEHASAAQVKALRVSLGLDAPWYVRMARYVERVAQGDLGASVVDAQPVARKLSEAFPATVELTFSALLFALLAGIPAGTLAALRHRTTGDVIVMGAGVLGVSVPVFWLGWLLIYVAAVLPARHGIDLFPISGRISLGYLVPARTHFLVLDALLAGDGATALDALRHLVLPAVTLGTVPLAIVAKITRAGMLEALHSDYVRTARAKGLAQCSVVMHHALRNALVPLLTVLGVQAGLLLGGAVLTEHIFAWPGVGRLAFDAIANRDAPCVNGCILLFVSCVVILNALVDISYTAIDPRIRGSA